MKRNKLTLLVAILLLGTMLLASCGGGNGDPTDPTFPTINKVDNNYSASIGAWAEYLSYIAPEATPEYKATEILSNVKIDDALAIYGELFVIDETKEDYKTVTPAPAEGTEPDPNAEPIKVLVKTDYIQKWYNKNTGELVKTFTSNNAVESSVEGVLKYDETINPLELVRYEINRNVNGLIEVRTTTLALKEVEAVEGAEPEVLDPLAVSSYESKTTYSYYFTDAKATLFLEKLESPLTRRSVENASAATAGRYLLDCEELDKTFLMEDGELVREFAYNMEYNVPVYDEDSYCLNGQGYAYFELGGNKYIVTESAPLMMPMGDLYMYLVQSMTLTVIGENEKVLVDYKTECYGISGYAVLSNGNVFVCEFELLNRDATEYDILSGEDKLNVHNKIINVADGSVTELELGFKASKLFNNTTKDINTFINYGTLGMTNSTDETLLASAKVKDGYILAEIQKYKDGTLDLATTWAVLDENLSIVKELPAIVADQFTYPSFMDANTMIVSARTVGNKLVYYGAHIKTGEISLLPTLNQLDDVQILNNGYFWGKKVYDRNWKEIRDFNETYTSDSHPVYTNFKVINGDLYYYNYYSSVSTTPTTFDIYRLTIEAVENVYTEWHFDEETQTESKKEIVTITYDYDIKQVIDDGRYTSYDGIFVEISNGLEKYYNLKDQYLFGEASTSTTFVRSEKLDKDVRYEISKDVYSINEIDGGYLVCIRFAYEFDSTTYTPFEAGLPQYFYEYEYYIVK